jgi:hypothetical protein
MFAFAAGVGIVLILEAGAYPSDERFQHQYLIGIHVGRLKLLVAFLCSFALCFRSMELR